MQIRRFVALMLFSLPAFAAHPVQERQIHAHECDDRLAGDPFARLVERHRLHQLSASDYGQLQIEGKYELLGSAVAEINELPIHSSRAPRIVLYSGESCAQCDLILPTYARSSLTFSGARLCYSKSAALKKRQNIYSTPRLVLYAGELEVQALGFAQTTSNFVELLKFLAELAQSSLAGHYAVSATDLKLQLFAVRNAREAEAVVMGQAVIPR